MHTKMPSDDQSYFSYIQEWVKLDESVFHLNCPNIYDKRYTLWAFYLVTITPALTLFLLLRNLFLGLVTLSFEDEFQISIYGHLYKIAWELRYHLLLAHG